jgi:type IV secretion system protein TrbJ
MSDSIQLSKFGRAMTAAAVAIGLATAPTTSLASGAVTGATEMTQLLNNGELITMVGKSSEQITNQITQISQLAQQIQNQLNIYQNMLQNTAQLPSHIWGQV